MGTLKPGDVILAINAQSLEQCNLREAAHALRNAGDVVTLTISKENCDKPTTGCKYMYMHVLYVCVCACVCHILLVMALSMFLSYSDIHPHPLSLSLSPVTPSDAVIFSVELHADGCPLGVSLTGTVHCILYSVHVCTDAMYVVHVCVLLHVHVYIHVCVALRLGEGDLFTVWALVSLSALCDGSDGPRFEIRVY